MGNFPGPEFWRKLLAPKKNKGPKREFSQECWDKAAQTYDDLESEPDYTRQVERVVQKMAERGLFSKDHTLLDVACGTGTYGLIFARHLKEVTGIDISQKMLERFRAKAKARKIDNVTIIHSDWRNLDLDAKFHIVFSSMNPLLGDYRNIDRMLELAQCHLVLVGWAGIRKNELLEKLAKKILGHALKAPKSDITVVFGYLYSLGYSPEIEYFTGTWHRTYEIKKQYERLIWRLEFERDLTEEEKGIVWKELESRVDARGMVQVATQIRTGMILVDKGLKVEMGG